MLRLWLVLFLWLGLLIALFGGDLHFTDCTFDCVFFGLGFALQPCTFFMWRLWLALFLWLGLLSAFFFAWTFHCTFFGDLHF